MMYPLIACNGSEAMKDKYGTNYKPVLALAKWVTRPAELLDQSPVDEAEVWQGEAPARQQATHVPAPQPAATALKGAHHRLTVGLCHTP
jgi:hypothetical protein